jgi:hypothetical protein
MPLVVAVGGANHPIHPLAQVRLDLATLAWGGGSTVPPDLPAPWTGFSRGPLSGGRLVVAGGESLASLGGESLAVAFEWAPGRAAGTPRPPMGSPRAYAGAAVRSDGRMLVAGGAGAGGALAGAALASVELLAADGNGWAALPPMAAARCGAVAGRLPGGQVIIAGGATGGDNDESLASAELWDPATGAWAALPPMAHARNCAAGRAQPSGRFAVLGGVGVDDAHREDAEAFDSVSRAWEPLPPMPRDMVGGVAVAVAGGLLAVGGKTLFGATLFDAMLFEEESGRWFTLPGQMLAGWNGHRLATVPAP